MSRRRLLKTTGSTGLAALGVSQGVSAQESGARPSGVEITDKTGMGHDGVKADVQTITNHDEAQTLASHIEDETGFNLDEESAVGVALETNDESLNERDPRILHLPMKPSSEGNVSLPGFTRESGSAQSEFSVDNGGVLLALTAREKGERTLATLMGMTRETSQSYSLLAGTTETVDTKSFVVQNGSAKKHRERTGQPPVNSNWQAEVDPNTGTVTTMDSGFTCWGCMAVVGIACATATTLSYSSCVSAAFASSVFSPWAFAAVGAFCTYIVANAGTLSCAAGATVICGGVTDDCDPLE